jgi:bacteriorhodopsin
MSEHWFKPHTYGYGATPSSWKGWAALAAYLVAMLAVTLPLLVLPVALPAGPVAWQIATAILLGMLLTVWFVRVCRARTDGDWRWRWGDKD